MARSLTRALVAMCATAVLGTMVVLPGPARAEPAPDPGPGTIALPPMTSARAGATLTQLADGGLLAVGGDTATSFEQSTAADRFDSLTRTWRPTAPSPFEHRRGHAAVRLQDGRVLIVGGMLTGPQFQPARAAGAVVYDPVGDVWSATGEPPTVRLGASLVTLQDGRVLLAGGGPSDAGPEGRTSSVYDPRTGTWSATGSTLTTSPISTASLLPDGDVLLSAGLRPQRWESTTGQWRLVAPQRPDIRSAGTTVPLADGRVLALGASRRVDRVLDQATLVYDPDTDDYVHGGRLDVDQGPVGTGGVDAVAVPDGRVALVGVENTSTRLRDGVLIRDPADQLWRDGGRLRVPRRDVAAEHVNGGVVVIGGGELGPEASSELIPVMPQPAPVSGRGRTPLVLDLAAEDGGAGVHVVAGHLVDRAGNGAADAVIDLWRRSPQRRDWDLVATARTDIDGLVSFEVDTTRDSWWVLRHAGGAATMPAGSHELRLFAPLPSGGTNSQGPEVVTLEAAQDEVRVSWLPPRNDGGSAVTGYDVAIRGIAGGELSRTTTDVSTTEAVLRVPEGQTVIADVRARTANGNTFAVTTVSESTRTEPGRRLSSMPTDGTVLCGRLPRGRRVLRAADSPVRLCRAGVVVPLGTSVVIDASGGPVDVLASGRGGLHVNGDLRTVGTAPTRRVRFGRGDSEQRWLGIRVASNHLAPVFAAPGDPLTYGQLVLDLAHVDVSGSREGLSVVGGTIRNRLEDLRIGDVLLAPLRVAGGPVHVRGLDVAGGTVTLSCPDSFDSTAADVRSCPITVEDSLIDGATGTALTVEGSGQLVVRNTTVLRTRLPASGTAQPSVVLNRVVLRAEDGPPLATLRGGGGALDVAVLRRTRLTGDVTWRGELAAAPADAPRVLDWLHDGLELLPGSRLAVPDGQRLVAATSANPSGGEEIQLRSATFETGAGSVVTGADDPTLPLDICRSSLARRCEGRAGDWRGISAIGGSTVRIRGSAVRYPATLLSARQEAAGDPENVVEIRDAELGPALDGVGAGAVVIPSAAQRTSSVLIENTVIRDVRSSPVRTAGLRSVVLRAVTVRDSGLLEVSGQSRPPTVTTPTPEPGAVDLRDVLLERSEGLVVRDARRPVVHRVTVRDATVNRGTTNLLQRAVTFIDVDASYGPTGDVRDLRGSGNSVDAVAISGTLLSSLTWRSPRKASEDEELGFVIGPSSLRVPDGVRLDVPDGGLVKADRDAGITLSGGDLTATGAVLTGTADNRGIRTCRSTCEPGWQGIGGGTASETAGSDILLRDTVVRGGRVQISGVGVRDGLPQIGSAVFDRVDSDSPVVADRAARLEVVDSTVGRLTAATTTTVRVERVTVTAGPVDVGRTFPGRPAVDLLLRDVAVLRPDTAAFRVHDLATTIGPGRQLDRLTARGPGAVLRLTEVDLLTDLDWATTSSTGDLHPVGLVTDRVALRNGAVLRVRAGDVVRASGLLLDGGLQAPAAVGAVITGLSDTITGTPSCTDPDFPLSCMDPSARGVELGPSNPGPGSSVLEGVDVRVPLSTSGGAGLMADSSRFLQPLSTTSSPLDLRRSQAMILSAFESTVSLTDVELRRASVNRGGALFQTGGALTADRLTAVGSTGSTYPVQLKASADTALRCADVQGSLGGILVDPSSSLRVEDSTLTGSATSSPARFDLDNQGAARTTRVWWGQPGGPRDGQVSRPLALVDVTPAASPPPCAGATAVAPVVPPSAVTATPVDRGAVIGWVASPDARVTGYRVVAEPGGQQTTVPATARTATLRGLPSGVSVRLRVLALTAAGDAPTAPSVAVAPADGGPIVSTFTVPTVVSTTTSGAVTATVAAQPGIRVAFRVGEVAATATADDAGQASVTVDVRTEPDGDLTWTASPTDAEGRVGATVSTTSRKDTAGPSLAGLTTPTGLSVEQSTVVVEGTTEADARVIASIGTTWMTKEGRADEQGRIRLAIQIGDGSGPFVVSLSGSDDLGNETTDSRTVIRESPQPFLQPRASRFEPVTRPEATAHQFSGTASDASAGSSVIRFSAPGGARIDRVVEMPDGQQRDVTLTVDLTPLPDGPVEVRALHRPGDRPRTDPSQLLELRAGPLAVRDLRAVAVPGGYDVTWSAGPEAADRPVDGYGLALSPSGGTVTISGTTARVRGRTEGGRITVVARTGDVAGAATRLDVGAPPTAGAGRFHALTPSRLLDTRESGGAVRAGADRLLRVVGSGGVPDRGVSAVVLNVTVTGGTARGDVQVYPAGQRPSTRTSNLNYAARQTVPVLVQTGVGSGGAVALSVNTGSAHVILDVFGWYGDGSEPATSGAGYTPVTPARVLDTRESGGAVRAGSDRVVPVRGRAGVPSDATAVVLNATALGTPANADVQIYPSGRRPSQRTSNLNVARGQVRANAVTTPLGDDGAIVLSVSQDSASVVLDVLGYYSAGRGDRFIPVAPRRVLDTRQTSSPVSATVDRDVAVPTSAVPSGATAAVLSVTATGATSSLDLQVFPTNDRPTERTSTLNLRPGEAVANLAPAGLGSGGRVTLSTSRGSSHIILDVAGYFIR